MITKCLYCTIHHTTVRYTTVPASGSSSLLSPVNNSSPTNNSRESSSVALSCKYGERTQIRESVFIIYQKSRLNIPIIYRQILSIFFYHFLIFLISLQFFVYFMLFIFLTLTSTVTIKKFSSLSLLYAVSVLLVLQRIFPRIVLESSIEHSLFDSNLSNNMPGK